MRLTRRRFIRLSAAALGAASAVGYADEPDRLIAGRAMDDLLRNFWVGDESTGRILNTWNGYPSPRKRDPRGGLWERATMFIALENAARTLDDRGLNTRIRADWKRTGSAYAAGELEACGAHSGTNWAADDAGWSALMYLAAHRVTGHPQPLDRARGLVSHAFARWLDAQLGGGMWYSDHRDTKSLYQIALVLAALNIWEFTGESVYHDRALECCDWIEKRLLREDGLYWCEVNRSGPVGANRPNGIREASSVTYLGGNMAMGVLHARLFRLTGDDAHRQRAIRTAGAIGRSLTTAENVYVNDRDAWTNGLFAGDWAREVLPLPGMAERHRAALRATAQSIYHNARTADGCYGASWSGPAEGSGSRWFVRNSKPQQIMTSACAVNMIVAAEALPDERAATKSG